MALGIKNQEPLFFYDVYFWRKHDINIYKSL